MRISLYRPLVRLRHDSSRDSRLVFAITLAVVLGWTHPAAAQLVANNFGDMLCNSILNGFTRFPDLLGACAYIAGTFFIGSGGIMLAKIYDNPVPIHHPLTRIGGGAFLLAAPSAVTALVNTIYGGTTGAGVGVCASGAVALAPLSLDAMLTNFVQNLKDPIANLTSDVAIVVGCFFIITGLIKASKYGVDPREHSMTKILARLVVGTAMVVIGQSFTELLNTLFGAGVTGSAVVAAWPVMVALGASPQFLTAVEDAGLFMELVGMIAFVRGWMIMKSASEGSGQATIAQGLTHMLGGVLAMNIFGFLEMMDATFGTGFL